MTTTSPTCGSTTREPTGSTRQAFRDAALGEPPDDPDGAAGRVKASAVRSAAGGRAGRLGGLLPPTGFGGIGSCGSRAGPTRTPGATAPATRPPGGTARPWPSWPGRHPSREQPPPLLLALGERLQLAGGDGVGLLRRVQEQYPDDFWTNFTLARAFYGAWRQGKGDWTAAAAYYQKALDLRPKAVAVHNNLGLVLADVGWLEDNADGRWGPGAITIFRRALRIDPDFAPARNNLGLWLKRKGIWWLAIHEYRDALRADPELAPAHFNLGEIDAGSGRINEAIDHYREALRVDPDFALAHYYLGIALLAKGRQRRGVRGLPCGCQVP